MKFIMNYYFFIYIWKEIYIINMIQSQPKLCDFVSLSDTYIQVTGDLCRNYADKNNLEISICFRRKLTKQKRENWNLPAETCQQKLEKLKPENQKRESWNLSTET